MVFDSQPTLRGEVLELRPLTVADFDALYHVAADPLLWEQHPAHTRHEREVFKRLFDESIGSGGALVAVEISSGQIVGSSRYHAYDADKSEVEIGWSFLARSYWGGRYNREMKHLMLQHAFRFVSRVLFLVGIDNIRSQRAVEKIGGVRMGQRLDASGNVSHVYAIDRKTFESVYGPASEDGS